MMVDPSITDLVPTNAATPLLEIRHVSRQFRKPVDIAAKIANRLGARIQNEVVHAVDNVNLQVDKGEVVGLVGESGSGKSTLGRIIAGLLPPSEGEIYFKGNHVAELSKADARTTGLAIQMIFQDPFASLNPRLRVKDIIGEAPLHHGLITRSEYDNYVESVMRQVGLDASYSRRYPHQFSGGQRQRISIARALAVKPEFIVCDEAVAALDVSIQAQILNLFVEIRKELDLTLLFISHDLGVVEHICDRVAVMYLGRIVEQGPVEDLFTKPSHPYTVALLEEVPRIDSGRRQFTCIKGEIPSPLTPPKGCHFHPRCPHAMPRCRDEVPTQVEVTQGHVSACHLNDSI